MFALDHREFKSSHTKQKQGSPVGGVPLALSLLLSKHLDDDELVQTVATCDERRDTSQNKCNKLDSLVVWAAAAAVAASSLICYIFILIIEREILYSLRCTSWQCITLWKSTVDTPTQCSPTNHGRRVWADSNGPSWLISITPPR